MTAGEVLGHLVHITEEGGLSVPPGGRNRQVCRTGIITTSCFFLDSWTPRGTLNPMIVSEAAAMCSGEPWAEGIVALVLSSPLCERYKSDTTSLLQHLVILKPGQSVATLSLSQGAQALLPSFWTGTRKVGEVSQLPGVCSLVIFSSQIGNSRPKRKPHRTVICSLSVQSDGNSSAQKNSPFPG